MKIVLVLSLLLNCVFGFYIFTKKEQPPLERFIIESHDKGREEKILNPQGQVVPAPEIKIVEEKVNSVPMFNSEDAEVEAERMEMDKKDFVTVKLGLPEDILAKHKKLREEFAKDTTLVWAKHPMGEIPFEERRKLLDREEKFYHDLEKLYGKENWKKYQKFRQEYNERGFKAQQEENRPFVFMGL